MEDERKVYAAKIKRMHTADKNKVLNMQLRDTRRRGLLGMAPDSPVHATFQGGGTSEAMQEELSRAREKEAELMNDREASVRALHQTIEATRELSARHADEKMKRAGRGQAGRGGGSGQEGRGRILATMDIQQDYPKPSSSSSSSSSSGGGGGAEKRQGAAQRRSLCG